MRNARFMVTFAELALEDVQIPYTTNKIERLMGEVSKRCKHKWMQRLCENFLGSALGRLKA